MILQEGASTPSNNCDGTFTNIAPALPQELDDAPTPPTQLGNKQRYSFGMNSSVIYVTNRVENPEKPEPKPSTQPASSPSENSCRFCFESTQGGAKGNLISPCKCSGSLQYIHEGCLRTWLMSQIQKDSSRMTAACEVCTYNYSFEGKKKLKFTCSRAFNTKFASFILAVCLAVSVLGLACVCARFVTLNADDDPEQSRLNKWLALLCGVAALLLVIPMILNIKKSLFEPRLVVGKIFNFDPKSQTRKIKTIYEERHVDNMFRDDYGVAEEEDSDMEAGKPQTPLEKQSNKQEQPSLNVSTTKFLA